MLPQAERVTPVENRWRRWSSKVEALLMMVESSLYVVGAKALKHHSVRDVLLHSTTDECDVRFWSATDVLQIFN